MDSCIFRPFPSIPLRFKTWLVLDDSSGCRRCLVPAMSKKFADNDAIRSGPAAGHLPVGDRYRQNLLVENYVQWHLRQATHLGLQFSLPRTALLTVVRLRDPKHFRLHSLNIDHYLSGGLIQERTCKHVTAEARLSFRLSFSCRFPIWTTLSSVSPHSLCPQRARGRRAFFAFLPTASTHKTHWIEGKVVCKTDLRLRVLPSVSGEHGLWGAPSAIARSARPPIHKYSANELTESRKE